MQITYSAQARKTLRKMQPKTAARILDGMAKLAEDPERTDLDVKKLSGREGYRLRVGDWRVIYTNDGLVLAVERIGPRGDVYKG
jgi:mRNA interferase RelE/StbE